MTDPPGKKLGGLTKMAVFAGAPWQTERASRARGPRAPALLRESVVEPVHDVPVAAGEVRELHGRGAVLDGDT